MLADASHQAIGLALFHEHHAERGGIGLTIFSASRSATPLRWRFS